MRRTYPHPGELSAEDQAALTTAQTAFDRLTEEHQAAEELADDVDARFGELEAEIERLEAERQAYDPDDIARGGAFEILSHDGTIRIERGFIRPADEKPQAETEQRSDNQVPNGEDGADSQAVDVGEEDEGATEKEDDDRPLSDVLVRDLTAHRALGLRLNLSEQPETVNRLANLTPHRRPILTPSRGGVCW
jgi:ParB family transcriptional regulator, chromosome partitioning protein